MWFSRPPASPYPDGVRLLVNIGNRSTIRGTLEGQTMVDIILRDAEFLRERQEPLKMDGLVVVPVRNVDFVQVLPA